MKRIYIICILVILLFFNTQSLLAIDTTQISENAGLDKIIDELKKYSDGLDIQAISDNLLNGEKIEYDSILSKITNTIKEAIIPCMKEVILILVFIVIVSTTKALELDKDSTVTKVANMLTVLIIITYLLSIFAEFAVTVKKVIGIQSSIIQIVSPFLMSLLILTGATTTAGIVQPAILLLVQIISFCVNYIIIPLLTISIVFSIITSISDKINLEKFGGMCNKTALWLNAIFLSIFLGVMSLGVSVSTSLDEITVKAAQTAVSGVIPVVGKFVSDSVEFVFGATEIISKTAGVLSIITLLMVIIAPIIKLTITVVLISFIAAIADSINTDKSVVKLLEKFSDTFKTMLGVLISTSITFVISLAVMMSLIGKIIE